PGRDRRRGAGTRRRQGCLRGRARRCRWAAARRAVRRPAAIRRQRGCACRQHPCGAEGASLAVQDPEMDQTGARDSAHRHGEGPPLRAAAEVRKRGEMKVRRTTYQHRVTFSDCDPARMAYYPRMLEWFDHSTDQLFRSVGLRWEEMFARNEPQGMPLL